MQFKIILHALMLMIMWPLEACTYLIGGDCKSLIFRLNGEQDYILTEGIVVVYETATIGNSTNLVFGT